MTFAIGRRFLIVDGVERWKDADVEATLAPALAGIAPDTTVAFFAREEGRAKAPAEARRRRSRRPGGDVVAETDAQGRRSCRAGSSREATRLGVEARRRGARRRWSAHVGERQQRLLRELEKLALEHGAGRDASASRRSRPPRADSAERQVWGLVDALVGARPRARDPRASSSCAPRARRCRGWSRSWRAGMREVLAIAVRLEAGESPAQVKASLRMAARGWPTGASRRRAATDADALQRALEALADLELATRGGSELDEDTAALRAIAAIAGRWGEARSDSAPASSRWPAARSVAARDFLRAPVLRCSAPRLTALSIVWTSARCSASAVSSSPARDRGLEAAEVRLDRRRVAAVLETLALGAEDALLL